MSSRSSLSKLVLPMLGVALVAGACASSSTAPAESSTLVVADTLASATTATRFAPSPTVVTTLATADTPPEPRRGSPVTFGAQIDEVFPHDREAFTQGLAVRGGLMYESTGVRGQSTVRVVDLRSGEVLSSVDLADEYFGEGLEVVGDRIVQLTLTSGIALIWDVKTLAPIGTFSYEGEGWGLCARGEWFYMSNGSSQLSVRDLETFEPIGTIDVTSNGEPVEFLNELECTPDGVVANVWKSDIIVVIDPDSGVVVGRVLTDSLRTAINDVSGVSVLNGIAYDIDTGAYYLTGKYWPTMFQVHLEEIPG